MACIHAPLNRYFRAKRGIDELTSLQMSYLYQLMKCSKYYRRKARRMAMVKLKTKKAISDEDYKVLREYFKNNMNNNVNPKNLQEIVLITSSTTWDEGAIKI